MAKNHPFRVGFIQYKCIAKRCAYTVLVKPLLDYYYTCWPKRCTLYIYAKIWTDATANQNAGLGGYTMAKYNKEHYTMIKCTTLYTYQNNQIN